MKKTNILRICAVAAAMIALLSAYQMEPAEKVGSKSIVITVINDTRKERQYFMNTDAQYLIQALDELEKDDFTYGSYEKYGEIHINKVNDLYAPNNVRWIVYIDGKKCYKSIDKIEVNSGNVFEIVYTDIKK